MRVVVRRHEWNGKELNETWTGQDKNSKLLNSRGKMCCLGFMCEQLGVSRDAMVGAGYPNTLCDKADSALLETLQTIGLVTYGSSYESPGEWYNTELSRIAATLNDALMPIESKEADLIKLFARYGHELVFED